MKVITVLQEQKKEIESRRELAIQKHWYEALCFLPDTVVVETGIESCRVKWREDGPYWRDIVDIYFYDNYGRTKGGIREVKVSYSSGGGSDDISFDKMVILGQIGSALKGVDHKTPLEELKNMESEEYDALRTAIWDLEKAEELKLQNEKDAEFNKFKNKAMKGLHFDAVVIAEECRYNDAGYQLSKQKLPSLEVRFNDGISNLGYFKITDISASGKTAKIEYRSWNFGYVPKKKNKHEFDFIPADMTEIRTYDRVQMKNIDAMLRAFINKDSEAEAKVVMPTAEEIVQNTRTQE